MKKNKVIIIISSLAALLLVCGVVFYLESASIVNILPNKDSSQNQIEQEGKSKKEAVVNTPKPSSSGSDKPGTDVQSYTPPQDSDNISLEAVQDASTVIVTAKLVGYSDGNCSLSIKNGTKSFSKTATIVYQREYSTCEGFSIPITELGTGSWEVLLTVTSGESTETKTLNKEVR